MPPAPAHATLAAPPRRRRAAPAIALALVVLAALAAAGCGGGEEPASARALREVAAGSLDASAPVPAPAEADVVLTLRGGSAANGDGALRLSLAQLEALPMVEATVYEPFLKRDVVFRGPRFADVVALAGYDPAATTLDTVAYNDYAVTLPLSVLRHPGVILATRADGAAIPLDEGGPTRVVFTDDHPDTRDESLWIWSLATVTAR